MFSSSFKLFERQRRGKTAFVRDDIEKDLKVQGKGGWRVLNNKQIIYRHWKPNRSYVLCCLSFIVRSQSGPRYVHAAILYKKFTWKELNGRLFVTSGSGSQPFLSCEPRRQNV
jgi:hypothetical protein